MCNLSPTPILLSRTEPRERLIVSPMLGAGRCPALLLHRDKRNKCRVRLCLSGPKEHRPRCGVSGSAGASAPDLGTSLEPGQAGEAQVV